MSDGKHEKGDKRRDQQSESVQFRLNLLDEIIACASPATVAAAVSVADVVSRTGIRAANASLVLEFLRTNNPYVVDALVGKRSAFLLLRNISPTYLLLKESFNILSAHNPGNLLPSVLSAVLGFLDIAYKVSFDGFGLYPFSMTELANIGKYLDENLDQFFEANAVILRILENIHDMGMLMNEWKSRYLAFQAMQIRMAYFDETKTLSDVIPEELLTRLVPNVPLVPEFVKSEHDVD